MCTYKSLKLIRILYAIACAIVVSNATAFVYGVQNQNYSSDRDYSSEIERRIRGGEITTADLIVDYHPRFWIRGNWDWDAHSEEGSFAWRFVHGFTAENGHPANDQLKHEVMSLVIKADSAPIFGEYEYATHARRFLWTIAAAEVAKRGETEYEIADKLVNGRYLAGSSSPVWPLSHTEDELLMDARTKLLQWHAEALEYPDECHSQFLIHASAGYDWLVDRYFSDGSTPVLNESERIQIQEGLISIADQYRERALEANRQFFQSGDICLFSYVAVGLALFEPDGIGISSEYNAKARQYLDDLDEYLIGMILPLLNEQGGTGGWHGGLCRMGGEWWNHDDNDDVLTYRLAPILFAHYTATGQEYNNSLMSSGFEKYAIEFQNYMLYPDGDYVTIGPQSTQRYKWIGPYFSYTRRRFSSDPENQRQGEIGGWIGVYRLPEEYRGASYDQFDQAMFEEKWPNPRAPAYLGCQTRHFAKLGWIAMRSGFTSEDDLAALFICQRYHWSHMDPYAQNSFHLMYKSWLIEGNKNTIWIDDQYQRTITQFPTIADGIDTYSPNSEFDVGPGIQVFGSNDQYDYMIGDATNAYYSEKLETFTRGLVWLKANNVFLMFDRVVTKTAESKKSWIVDPGATPQVKGDGLVKISNMDGALWIKRLLPDEAEVVLSENKIEVVPVQATETDYFLFVLQAVDASFSQDSPKVIADQAELLEQEDKIGFRVDGWEVFFARNGESTIWVNGQPVLVEVLLFEATPENGAVKCTWQTASEMNNYGFEIERSSENTHFRKIGFVRGSGTTNVLQSYEFRDETVNEGTYYYRLKQLSLDGSFRYSHSVSVVIGSPYEFTLEQNFPNPCTPSTEIAYSLPFRAHINLAIYNVLGQKIKTMINDVQKAGRKSVKWDGKDSNGMDLAPGVYICRLETAYCVLARKFLLLSHQ